MRKYLLVAVAMVATFSVAVAADVIKLELKDFKVLTTDGKENPDALGYNEGDSKLFFYTTGVASVPVKFADDAEYELVLELSCDKAKEELAKIKIKLGDKVIKEDFALTTDGTKEYKFDVKGKKGEEKLTIEFLNDTYKEGEYDLNFYIHSVKLEPKKK